MERAIEKIQGLINSYDYWVRDCHPYFRESEEKYKARKNELAETLKELRQSVKILSNEREGLGKHEQKEKVCSVPEGEFRICKKHFRKCTDCEFYK